MTVSLAPGPERTEPRGESTHGAPIGSAARALRSGVGAFADRLEQASVVDLVEVRRRVPFGHRLRVDEASADRSGARIDRLHPAAEVLVLMQAEELVGAAIRSVVEIAEPGVG